MQRKKTPQRDDKRVPLLQGVFNSSRMLNPQIQLQLPVDAVNPLMIPAETLYIA